MTEQIIPNVSVPALLARRAQIAEHVREILAANDAIDTIARQEDSGVSHFDLYLHDQQHDRMTYRDYMKRVDRSAWQFLLERSGLWTFMDAKARAEWRDSWDRFEMPELTEENVEAAFETLHTQRGKFVARGVHDLFRRLSRYHKTNEHGRRFTKKIIVEYVLDGWGWPHLSSCDALDDLNRTLHVLRGLTQPEHQTKNAYSLLRATVDGERPWVAEFPFFRVRLFKKGTGHVLFDHEEDVDRLNKTLSIYTQGEQIPPKTRRTA